MRVTLQLRALTQAAMNANVLSVRLRATTPHPAVPAVHTCIQRANEDQRIAIVVLNAFKQQNSVREGDIITTSY